MIGKSDPVLRHERSIRSNVVLRGRIVTFSQSSSRYHTTLESTVVIWTTSGQRSMSSASASSHSTKLLLSLASDRSFSQAADNSACISGDVAEFPRHSYGWPNASIAYIESKKATAEEKLVNRITVGNSRAWMQGNITQYPSSPGEEH